MSLLDDLVRNAEIIANGYNEYRAVIDGTVTEVNIPKGTTGVQRNAITYRDNLETINLNEGLTYIGREAFVDCTSLKEVIIPSTVDTIWDYAFFNCYSIEKIVISHGVYRLWNYCFGVSAGSGHTQNLVSLWLPNTLTNVASPFDNALSPDAVVTLENGFNCNKFYLIEVTNASIEQIISWLNALADRTGDTAYTLYIGPTNIAKLTSEQIAIATNKNWNLA